MFFQLFQLAYTYVGIFDGIYNDITSFLLLKRELQALEKDHFFVIVIFCAVEMNNFSFSRLMLHGICFLAIQQGIAANESNCQTPQLGPTEVSSFKMGVFRI